MTPLRALAAILVATTMLTVAAHPCAGADDAQRGAKPDASANAAPPPARTADDVLASLNRAMSWYRQARLVMASVEGTGVFGHADEQTALRLVGRAFDVAHAEAALLNKDSAQKPDTGGRRSEEQKQIEATIGQGEQEVQRLRARIQAEPAKRAALERDLAAAQNKLELNRSRIDFYKELRQLEASRANDEDDLDHQIDALKEAVPELGSGSSAQPVSAMSSASGPGTWGTMQRLLALQRSRGNLRNLESATNDLIRRLDDETKASRARVRPLLARLQALAKDPTDSGKSLADSQREFRDLLERRKLLVAVALPLRDQAALARRFADDLKGWNEIIDRQSLQALQGLAFDLLGVLIALAVIFICGVLWRVAVTRYVTDTARRRMLLTARSIVLTTAVALVLIFHFTSEMAALVTALGFAAAGIAFALQNVILAVAGYFTMVAPNGIRIGDRVSLQGPFGYVHGQVAEIGFVRVKLNELAGEPLKPTGRIVVFPNSVVFTGTFFKDPAAS